MPHDFAITSSVLANGRTVYHAKLNNSTETKFVIGYRTLYDQVNFGVYNTSVLQGHAYDPSAFSQQFGFWAHFIYPSVMAESKGSYFCLNTYDRARFTFTFMQYAAHVPNGDFVRYLKRLLALPNALEYFPKLLLQNGRIFYKSANGVLSQLENDSSTQPLMNYFNPTLNEVETQELICSARLVHWAMNHPRQLKIQVESAIELYKENMADYHNRYGLENVPAKVCQMICDIRHQGRGKNDRIANALNTNGDYEKAFNNLCSIGSANYQSRINTVRTTINSLVNSGIFRKKYKSSN